MISFWSGAKRFFLKSAKAPKQYRGVHLFVLCHGFQGHFGCIKNIWKKYYVHLEGIPLKINMEPKKKHHWKGKSSSKAPFWGSMVYSSNILPEK